MLSLTKCDLHLRNSYFGSDRMKKVISDNNKKVARKRIVAIAALLIIAGGSTVGIVFSQKKKPQAEKTANNIQINASAMETGGTISAGGTITSAQLYDYIGLESTAVRLQIEEVYVESGNSVTAGTQLYKLTDETVTKGKSTLEKELKSAENALLDQKLSYEKSKNSAYSLYQSELSLGDTAQSDYNDGITQLNSKLEDALNDYNDALNTVNTAPSEIESKQSELDYLNSEISDMEERLSELESEKENKKSAYTQASDNLNAVAAEYNSVAGTVKYIGNYIGIDVSDVELSQGAAADIPQQDKENNDNGGDRPSGGNMPEFGGEMGDIQFKSVSSYGIVKASDVAETDSAETMLMSLYEDARAKYEKQKNILAEAENTYSSARTDYEIADSTFSELQSSINENKSTVTSLKSEISKLESSYSSAKSKLSSLKAEYNSLKLSYETDKLTLKNTYDTSMASYENAQYHYDLTMSTIENELEAAEEAVAVCEENLRVFEETLADGIIEAQQDGVIYSLSYEAEDIVNISSPLVNYVDDTSFGTIVELDQYDVTEIAIGDSVIIYSSESGMTNGRITSVSAGESTSLANVIFNVTVVAEGENVNLYTGQSVNVYFNAMSMDTSKFSDYENNDENGEEGSFGGFGDFGDFGGERPDMGSFNPGNMPDMNFGGGERPQRGN